MSNLWSCLVFPQSPLKKKEKKKALFQIYISSISIKLLFFLPQKVWKPCTYSIYHIMHFISWRISHWFNKNMSSFFNNVFQQLRHKDSIYAHRKWGLVTFRNYLWMLSKRLQSYDIMELYSANISLLLRAVFPSSLNQWSEAWITFTYMHLCILSFGFLKGHFLLGFFFLMLIFLIIIRMIFQYL